MVAAPIDTKYVSGNNNNGDVALYVLDEVGEFVQLDFGQAKP